MSVSSVGSTTSYATTVSVQVVQVRVEILPPATQTEVSQTGTLLSRLDELSKSDPEKFKAAMSQVASVLREQAGKAQGRQANVLTMLADRFEATAKSGRLETLFKAPSPDATAAAGSTAGAAGGASATGSTSAAGAASSGATASTASGTASATSATGTAATETAAASAQAAGASATSPRDDAASEAVRKGKGHHGHHRRHHHHHRHDEEGGEGQGWRPGRLLAMVADVVRAALDTVVGAVKTLDAAAAEKPAGTTMDGSSAGASQPTAS